METEEAASRLAPIPNRQDQPRVIRRGFFMRPIGRLTGVWYQNARVPLLACPAVRNRWDEKGVRTILRAKNVISS